MSDAERYLLHLVHLGDIGPPQEPPLFDWRQQLDAAAQIIKDVARPIRIISARGYRERPSVDLSGKEESLARLLAEAAEEHVGALAYFEAAATPLPRVRKSQRKKPRKGPGKNALLNAYEAIYSEVEAETEYNRLKDILPRRGPGNDSTSKDDLKVAIGPLVPIYWMSKRWWEEHVGPGFTPSFAGGDDAVIAGHEYEDCDDSSEQHMGSDYNNADSRFLLGILSRIEPKCQARHAFQLYERLRHLEAHRISSDLAP